MPRGPHPGSARDNALAESFLRHIKHELPGTAAWPSRAVARTAIFDFTDSWYHLHHLPSSLGYHTPAQYAAALAA
ncbi:integrase core domain-containing protein [Streptomyces sp. NPDC007205]|uniref:integrase core domain-containing protein n=1 Tax=Streptomyces sp. NPDC007205 TaxID=3154316 RepID=UPI0033F0D1FD